jgi:hypothetical protein
MNSPAIRRVLDLHFKRTETEATLLEVRKSFKQLLRVSKKIATALESLTAREKSHA